MPDARGCIALPGGVVKPAEPAAKVWRERAGVCHAELEPVGANAEGNVQNANPA